MPTSQQQTIITDGQGHYKILKGNQYVDYTGPVPGAQPDLGFKVGDTEAINHAWDILDSINAARGLSHEPLAAGSRAEAIRGIPLVGGMVGQNRDNLQTKLGAIAGDLRQLGIHNLYQQIGGKGGSIVRSVSEQQALQSSMAPLGFVEQGGHASPTGAAPDAATLGQGLDTAQQIYLRHLARLYGKSPDDPNVLATIEAGITDKNKRNTLGLAFSNAPADTTTSSGATTVETNPAVAKIKDQLATMLNAPSSKVSNQQINDFVRANGVDPDSWGSLQSAMKQRDKSRFNVDPRYNTPKKGVGKVISEIGAFDPGGVPIGASVVGAGDMATAGLAPDVAGIVHGVTGIGPSRADVVAARDASAAEHPLATFLGNAAGAVVNPLMRGGGVGRTALLGGLYGGASSSNPDVYDRLVNAGIGASVGGLAHVGTNAIARGLQGAVRNLRTAVAPITAAGTNGVADANALARAAETMPPQDIAAVKQAVAGGDIPAAAAVNPAGQAFLQKVAASSPQARTAAEAADKAMRGSIPEALAGDFNAAINDITPEAAHQQAFLSRPTREIAKDVQDMAGREFESGITPIKNEPVAITPDLQESLSHERISGAIKYALNNHKLDPATRDILRNLPAALKSAKAPALPPGVKISPEQAAQIKAIQGGAINVNVDSLRNIATALNTTANSLQSGSEGALQLRDLSRELRGAIEQQYPEYGPVNSRYASRMRAIDAMDAARSNFLGDTPESIDALSKASGSFTPAPNEPEYKGPAVDPSGPVLPSNQQFAAAGAREAATTRAGAGTNQGGTDLLRKIAEGVNQQTRNQMVLGDQAANIAAQAGKRANVADVVSKIATGPTGDQTGNWFRYAKYALMTKATGGAAHYAVAKTLAGVPKLSADDAARVTNIFLNADSADQATRALEKAYGKATARNIVGRMTGIGISGREVRDTPQPQPQPVIGSPF